MSLIKRFARVLNEFYTPYRVINYHTCNSCWNDPRQMFDHHDFFWCPRHKGTDRQFECSRLITIDHVKRVIEKMPSVARRLGACGATQVSDLDPTSSHAWEQKNLVVNTHPN